MYNELEIKGYGAKYYVDQLVDKLSKQLWTDKTYQPYGMVEIVDGKPYVVNDKKYTEVLLDSSYDATSFFHVVDELDVPAPQFSVDVDIVFSIKTKNFTLKSDRGIYQFVYDAVEVVNKSPFQIIGTSTNQAAYENFDIEVDANKMAPFFLFKLTTNLFGNLKI